MRTTVERTTYLGCKVIFNAYLVKDERIKLTELVLKSDEQGFIELDGQKEHYAFLTEKMGMQFGLVEYNGEKDFSKNYQIIRFEEDEKEYDSIVKIMDELYKVEKKSESKQPEPSSAA